MTTASVLGAVLRRWYVALLGILLTAGMVYLVHDQPPVYYTEVQVRLLPPAASKEANVAPSSSGLIALAGYLDSLVNAGRHTEEVVSPTVTLTDMGVRHGVTVFLPNEGGQWLANFTEPLLVVRAAGPTPEEAVRLRTGAVDEITATLVDLQAADGVPKKSRVTFRLLPKEPRVVTVGGSPTRAAALSAVLGLWASVVACVVVDHVALTRRRSRARRRAVAEPEPAA